MCQTIASFDATRTFLTPTGILLTNPLEIINHDVAYTKSVIGPNRNSYSIVFPPTWFQSWSNSESRLRTNSQWFFSLLQRRFKDCFSD